MRDYLMGAAVRLLLCPGKCDHSEICKMCAHRGRKNCRSILQTDVLSLLQECEADVRSEEPEVPDLEVRVTKILHELGVPAHIKGYHYLRFAIIHTVHDQSLVDAVTKELYPLVAKEFGTTASRVERAMRHGIEMAWDRGDIETLQRYFGWTISNTRGKATNSEFVAMISDQLRLEMERKAK